MNRGGASHFLGFAVANNRSTRSVHEAVARPRSPPSRSSDSILRSNRRRIAVSDAAGDLIVIPDSAISIPSSSGSFNPPPSVNGEPVAPAMLIDAASPKPATAASPVPAMTASPANHQSPMHVIHVPAIDWSGSLASYSASSSASSASSPESSASSASSAESGEISGTPEAVVFVPDTPVHAASIPLLMPAAVAVPAGMFPEGPFNHQFYQGVAAVMQVLPQPAYIQPGALPMLLVPPTQHSIMGIPSLPAQNAHLQVGSTMPIAPAYPKEVGFPSMDIVFKHSKGVLGLFGSQMVDVSCPASVRSIQPELARLGRYESAAKGACYLASGMDGMPENVWAYCRWQPMLYNGDRITQFAVS